MSEEKAVPEPFSPHLYFVQMEEAQSGKTCDVIGIPASTMSDAHKMAKVAMMQDTENDERWFVRMSLQMADDQKMCVVLGGSE